MLTPSSEIIQLLSVFAVGMSAPTFAKAVVLIYGAILAPGRRTVASSLRVMGHGKEQNPGKYHRVLNEARWSPMHLSRLLLGLLVATFVPDGVALVILVDETLERRAGKRIGYKGWFRDAVRSVGNKVAVSLGIRWCCLCLLVRVPWSSRAWALPFLAVPVLSKKTAKRLKKRHRSGVWWTCFLIEKVRAWCPEREITLIGDGGYAAVELVACCPRLRIKLVSRLRVDAQLYAFPGSQPSSKRGPSPRRGRVCPLLQCGLPIRARSGVRARRPCSGGLSSAARAPSLRTWATPEPPRTKPTTASRWWRRRPATATRRWSAAAARRWRSGKIG